MLGAIATGALSTRFRMKNVLGTTYLIRVFLSLGFLFLPKTAPFAFIMTALLGATGDSAVPTTMGTITRKFGAKKIGVTDVIVAGAAVVNLMRFRTEREE